MLHRGDAAAIRRRHPYHHRIEPGASSGNVPKADGWMAEGRARRGNSQRPRRAGSSDTGFPGQAVRSLELPAMERLRRGIALRIRSSLPGVLAGDCQGI